MAPGAMPGAAGRRRGPGAGCGRPGDDQALPPAAVPVTNRRSRLPGQPVTGLRWRWPPVGEPDETVTHVLSTPQRVPHGERGSVIAQARISLNAPWPRLSRLPPHRFNSAFSASSSARGMLTSSDPSALTRGSLGRVFRPSVDRQGRDRPTRSAHGPRPPLMITSSSWLRWSAVGQSWCGPCGAGVPHAVPLCGRCAGFHRIARTSGKSRWPEPGLYMDGQNLPAESPASSGGPAGMAAARLREGW